MKNSKVKLIFTAFTILALMLTTACGASNNAANKATSTAAATAAATTEASSTQSVTPVDPFEKYTTPIEVDTVHEQLDADSKFIRDETLENNIWTKAYLNDFGIKLKYRWSCSTDKYVQKMQLTIASGDLPEMFMVNSTMYDQLIQTGQIADLTDAYDRYASPLLKNKCIEGDGGVVLNSIKVGGKIYGIPSSLDYSENPGMIWIRSDWLKKLNLPVPKTAQDLFNVAEAFTTKDPDGNGKNDTYGIAMNNQGIGYGTSYWDMFHSYPVTGDHGFFIKDTATGQLVDGQAGNPDQLAATKAAMLKLQELYKKGIISKEFATMDTNKMQEEEVAGKCGITFGGLWDPWWPLIQQKQKDPKIDWMPIPIPSIDDKPALTNTEPFGITGIYVMRKDTQHPEALIKMLNLYAKVDFDPTFYGNDKDQADYGAVNAFKYSPVSIFPQRGNYTAYLHVSKALDEKSDKDLPAGEKPIYKYINDYYNKGDVNQWPYARSYTHEGCEEVNDYYIKNNLYLLNAYYGPPTKTQVKLGPLVTKLWPETFIKIVMGADISEYDKYLEKIKNLGGDDITKEVNDWYATHKTN